MAFSLHIDCGFARTAIRELSFPADSKLKKRQIDLDTRKVKFQDLFSTQAKYSIEPSYFDKKPGHALSKFDKHCKPVLDSFARKWHPSTAQAEHLTTFYIANWEALPKSAKSKHCLTDCRECTKQFLSLQQSFPARKKQVPRATKQAESACTGFLESTLPANGSESEATQSLVEGMDRAYQDAFGHSFLESVLQHCPDKQIQKKRSPVETKRQRRKIT